MIRVVLDTNIVVSALLSPAGPPAQVFVLVLGGSIQLCISGSVYAEYEEVLRRPKLSRDAGTIGDALHAIRDLGIWVKPAQTIRACPDKDDNIFLECAEAACADFVVTGNIRHFPSCWGNTRVVTARGFLDLLPTSDSLD